jgi:malate synthase
MEKVIKNKLKISKVLYEFLENDVLSPLNVNSDLFWKGFEEIIYKFSPLNKKLLEKRDEIKNLIDDFYKNNKDKAINQEEYISFLKDIGYIVPEGPDFKIETENVDEEIAKIAGPQLVVPVTNARYSLNAANARWGSLYDALYGTDLIPEEDQTSKNNNYNPKRGEKVIEFGRNFLDEHFPLTNGSHHDAISYEIENKKLIINFQNEKTTLKEAQKFVGFSEKSKDTRSILLKNNNLHVEIVIDPNQLVGKSDKAGINDIILESAITTIQDCEDSVAAVDAEDKVLAYKNWLGLMNGSLKSTFQKGDKVVSRELNNNKVFEGLNGKIHLSGLSLMLIRNVGHLMTNPAIIYEENKEVPEGIMDGVITSLIALFDIQNKINSNEGSIYIVKPKMHGPEEVAFTNELFESVENLLNLNKYTIKIGIMDEERRTTVNLKECIRQAKHRLVFINTGFLDRTGDEIHTAMEAGPIIPKPEIKNADWIDAYEKNNVYIGLKCGLSGKAQIGKGMWAMPDLMKDMYEQKINHPESGANTAWVPSPTAATIHALHYHKINIFSIQEQLLKEKKNANYLHKILNVPVTYGQNFSTELIEREINNNAQGILGYVVRWIDQGVGCSKVPDINNIGLMEDRATCRISSQHLANWLHHEIISEEQLLNCMKKMAKVVDNQNVNDKNYQPMSMDFEKSIAFNAALDLILMGTKSPSGYTEPILHERRLKLKSNLS